ncbi:MAG: extracellular solute-binding protein, partial [Betaproteobacteria bacterium]|nr:extracellular solute-binding protein [Betaproteobacteria bacterium]
VCTLALWVMLNATPVGRHVYAIGGNPQSARVSGINVDRVLVLVYTICGGLAGLGGLLLVGRTGSAFPNAGLGAELDAIAAVIIGGASLWVMAGKKKEDYKGVAKFFNYVASPEQQAQSHQMTGYLPITSAAYDITRKSGFYEKNPGTDVSVQQMIVKTTDKSRGLRLGNFVQIRTIIDEELEGVWAGKQDAKAALERIEQRGNEQLARFARTAKE